MQKRRVVILGSTGSIGTSALKVARDIPDRMEIVGLAAGTSVEALARQAREFNVRSVCIFNPSGADELARALPGAQVLPAPSVHTPSVQCLHGNHGGPEAVSRLILTASGGPFRTWNREDLEHVTLEQALNHPTWSMGRKITIDSATLFNKGLEMIEARWLFDVPMEKVDVIVHPQSIVHSMVEYRDGTVLAQMSSSDMCFPIQYAVTWPDRVPNSLKQLNFAEIGRLVFEAPRTDVFPALNLARRAGAGNSTLAAVYNAANEAAVNAFIHGQISFPGIWKLVEAVMDDHTPADPRGELAPILEADQWARRRAAELLPSFSRPC